MNNLPEDKKLLRYKTYLVKWIKNQVLSNAMEGVIVGISGGVDSALVAALAKEALGDQARGVIMPIGNMGVDQTDALSLVSHLNLPYQTVDLTKTYEAILASMNLNNRLGKANIKARLRMSALYALAQEHRLLVLGTDNAAEWALGYFTKYGDGGVDLLPIKHLLKGDVKRLAFLLGLPVNLYTKAPTAALWENQTDEAELGFTYAEADAWLLGKPINQATETKILKQVNLTRHKRVALPSPKALHKLRRFD